MLAISHQHPEALHFLQSIKSFVFTANAYPVSWTAVNGSAYHQIAFGQTVSSCNTDTGYSVSSCPSLFAPF